MELHQAQVISGLQTSPHPNNINQISSAHAPTLNDAQNKIPHLETPHLALKSYSSTTSEAPLVLGVSEPFQPLPHATNIYMSTLEVAPSVVIAHNNFHPHETSILGQKTVINTALVDDNVSMSDLHFQDYPQTRNTHPKIPEQVPMVSLAQNKFSYLETPFSALDSCISANSVRELARQLQQQHKGKLKNNQKTQKTIMPNQNCSSEPSFSDLQVSSAKHHSNSVETVVPCSLSPKKNNNSIQPMQHSSSFYKKNTPTPSTNRSLTISNNTFKNKNRFHNQFDPISDLHWEGDGDGENWNTFGSSEYDEDDDDDSQFSSSHNDALLQAVQPSPGRVQNSFLAGNNLTLSEALDWGTMAEDEPLPSREACADAAFEAAINRNIAQPCCLLKEDTNSSILNQDFPPLQGTKSVSPQSPPSTNSRPISHTPHSPTANSPSPSNTHPSSSSNYTPTPKLKHQKTKKVLLIHKQKKLSKATIREANALSRRLKHISHSLSHDPDEYQWQILLADQKKRETEATANVSLHIPSISATQGQEVTSDLWKVTVYPSNHQEQAAISNKD
ncbi:hypothetical protein LguiB_005291 [Lonicera macranthoides]